MTLIKTNGHTPESIRVDIFSILKEKFDVRDSKTKKFFGLDGLLNASELVYLVHILEERYNIIFTDEDIDEDRFYTADGIADIINSKINPETQLH